MQPREIWQCEFPSTSRIGLERKNSLNCFHSAWLFCCCVTVMSANSPTVRTTGTAPLIAAHLAQCPWCWKCRKKQSLITRSPAPASFLGFLRTNLRPGTICHQLYAALKQNDIFAQRWCATCHQSEKSLACLVAILQSTGICRLTFRCGIYASLFLQREQNNLELNSASPFLSNKIAISGD